MFKNDKTGSKKRTARQKMEALEVLTWETGANQLSAGQINGDEACDALKAQLDPKKA